jgi:small subunit ribosomal protein S1
VLSRRALLRREEKAQAAKLLQTLKEGMEFDGKVTRIQPFGAFVDIGGLEGLVHVSEIQHGHVSNPNDVLKAGQEVRVRVLRMEKDDKGRMRIGLSMKAAQPDPWEEIAEQFWQGKKTQGTVVRMQDFGAFIELTPGIDGLVHVSEISHTPVRHPKDVLEAGQRVDVTVLNVDTERKRISLSIKDQLAREEAPAGEEGAAPARGSGRRGAATGGGSGGGTGAEKAPKVGDIVDGVVANIKPYGLFIDLPIYGARTRGLCPREETGEKRGTELEKRFSPGTPLKVAVIEVQPDGKIRLSITAVQNNDERTQYESFRKTASPGAAGNRGGNTAMAEAFKRAMQKPE